MRTQALVGASLLVGAALGAAGVTLAREQTRDARLEVGVSCEPFDPQGPYLGPTGVHLDVGVVFRSAADLLRRPEGEPEIEVAFSLPPRWTAYARGSAEARETETEDRGVVKIYQLPVSRALGDLRGSVREGELRFLVDVLGPTDAAPDRFAVGVSMADVGGHRLVRMVDDPCPLPPGSLHEAGTQE